MARHHHQHPLIRYSMPATVVLLVVTSVTPLRYLEWVGWVGGLVSTVVTPISDPMVRVARWLAPASRVVEDDERISTLEFDRDEFKRRLLAEKRRNAELESRIADLEAGVRRAPDAPVKQITRPVVGTSSDPSSGLLRVRAGRNEGVVPRTVTTVRGTQLHGQVVSVDRLECVVMPITEPESGLLRGRVLLDRLGDDTLLCQLAPTGAGTLRGDVEFQDPPAGVSVEQAIDRRLQPGVEVVLDDPAWPESAQMFTIGIVERVTQDENQPLRSVIVVRPRDGLELRRVREVVLRVPIDPTGDSGEGAP
jgi:hypothetical protein